MRSKLHRIRLPSLARRHWQPSKHASCQALASATQVPTHHKSVDWSTNNAQPPWQAQGQGKARRLFEADQGHSKRVIGLARDQTILKLTSIEFKDRLADVLCLLPELHLSAVPPKTLAKLVLMPPTDIAERIVLLASLFKGEEDINDMLLTEPSLLTIPFKNIVMQFDRLMGLLTAPRRITYNVAYSNADVGHFIALHPQFLLEENVIASFRALQVYFGKALEARGTVVQDYVVGNPGMLLKGYQNIQNAPVHNMASNDDSFRQWWNDPHKGMIASYQS